MSSSSKLIFFIFFHRFIFVGVLGTFFSILFSCCKKSGKTTKAEDSEKYENRVQNVEMADDKDLYRIMAEKKWYKNQSLIDMTELRLKRYKKIFERNLEEKEKAEAEEKKFDTLASYNFRVRFFVLNLYS